MKKITIILLTTLSVLGCSKEDSLSSADRNVVSDSKTIQFEELLIIINVMTSDSTYLVVKSIDSVNIYINNYYWSKLNSVQLDTTKIDYYITGNIVNAILL